MTALSTKFVVALLAALPLSLGAAPAPSTMPQGGQATTKKTPLEKEPLLKTTIGMRGRIEELPLPGTQLRAKPVADATRADMIVRVINVFPHGDAFRYNLEVTPYVPGTLDLRAGLERVDGSTTDDLPVLPIDVKAVLPPARIQPNELDPGPPQRSSWYWTLAYVWGTIWVVGLLAIVFISPRRKSENLEAAARRAPTLADRLRPLVEKARDGELDEHQRAELERLMMAHWRRRLDLMDQSPGKALIQLRQHEEAGALLRQLEDWLHRPDGQRTEVDVAALLAPYEDVAASEVEDHDATSAKAAAS